MADNIRLQTATGSGPQLRTTEDASTFHHQHIILELDDGTTTPVALVGGAGAVAGGVLRTTLASDDPGVGHLATLAGAVTAAQVQVDIAAQSVDLVALGKAAENAPAAGAPVLIGGRYDATPRTLGDGDAGALALHSDGSALIRGLPAAATATDNMANPSTVGVLAYSMVWDGTAWDRLRATTAGRPEVAVVGNVTIASGMGADGDSSAGAASLLTGARASNNLEAITQVDNGDKVQIAADLNGALVTRNATTLEELLSTRQTTTASTEFAATNFGAGGAGVHNYITSITVTNTTASTFAYLDLKDGSAGTVIWTIPNPAAAGGTHNFDPPLKQPTANTALYLQSSAAITTAIVSVAGFQAQG